METARVCWLWLCLATMLPACQRGGSQSAPPKPETFEGLLQSGQDAFKQGQYEQALGFFEKALEKQPRSAVVHNLIGMSYRFQYNQALSPDLKQKEINAFLKAVEIEPDFVVALVNLGSTYYFEGRKKEAALHFKRALERMPNHPEAGELKKLIAEGEGTADAPLAPSAPQPHRTD